MGALEYYYYATSRTDNGMASFPFDQSSPFDLSDFVLFDETVPDSSTAGTVAEAGGGGSSSSSAAAGQFSVTGQIASSSTSRSNRGEGGGGGGGGEVRVAFRTRSDVDVLDDGYKWRKYGKKSVKNSPNPRNYYRCSTEGCSVKKRVERDREDPAYVITTYDGVHNHTSPDVVYYATQDSASGQFVVSGRYGRTPPGS